MLFSNLTTQLAAHFPIRTALMPFKTPIIYQIAKVHRSAYLLAKKSKSKDYRKKINCPESQESKCNPLKKRVCKSTDAPVRPCSEEDCKAAPKYECCINTRIAANPCEKSGHSKEFKAKPEPFKSMWESPKGKESTEFFWDYPEECCPKCDIVRFDELYYHPSDKCRKYQRTWSECCPRMVPRRICCWCDAIPPEIQRRSLPICPRSACLPEHELMRMRCMRKKNRECPRLTMPCCRAARIPPACHKTKVRTPCKKMECPFPSFSECTKIDKADIPERPYECRCLNMSNICTVSKYYNRAKMNNLKIFPCKRD